MSKPGKVFLIGAGPGDPGLITQKGMACLSAADTVVYDYLASPALLAHARPDAEIIYVGKKGGDHTLSQDGINALIVDKGLSGRTVARLKGGDPFIFGRGGEEAQELIRAGVPFEIVPGVTSAIAAPAYAGIPLTHREHASAVAFVTGHEDPTREESNMDWEALARFPGTLVFLMGVKNLPNISARLMEHGKAPDTPAALVRWGTTTRQQTLTARLDNVVEKVKEAGFKAPSIILIGSVVTLREEMKWFENRPLFGLRVVVTRARAQASDLTGQLTELGAKVVECPAIRIVEPEDFSPMDAAVQNLSSYDWIVFTSVNGVSAFFERVFKAGRDSRALGGLRTAAIGPVTRKRLLDFGIDSDVVPKTYRAESVVEAFEKEDMSGKRVLLPRAEEARPVLPEELKKMGAHVDEVTAYRTVRDLENSKAVLDLLEKREIDVVTFTSSSTVRHFHSILPENAAEKLLKGVTLASIGPITTQTAEDLGLSVKVSATEYTIPGLVNALVHHFSGKGA